MARQFFGEIVRQVKQRGWMSSKHFSVDGTTGEAWASQKSFRPKQEKRDDDEPKEGGRNREVDFRGQQRRNETQESATDAEARLWRKSQTAEAKRSDLGHVLGQNRHGLIGNVRVTRAHGRAGGAGSGSGDGERDTGREEAGDAGGGSGLRHAGVCRTAEGSERDAACGAERERAAQRGGWADDAARGLLGEPAEAEGGGGIVRVGEGGGWAEGR